MNEKNMKRLEDQDRVEKHVVSSDKTTIFAYPGYYQLITSEFSVKFSHVELNEGYLEFYRSCGDWSHPIFEMVGREFEGFIKETLVNLEAKK